MKKKNLFMILVCFFVAYYCYYYYDYRYFQKNVLFFLGMIQNSIPPLIHLNNYRCTNIQIQTSNEIGI